MSTLDLSGTWRCEIPGQTAEILLPGTLDENGVGHPDMPGKPWHPDVKLDNLTLAGDVIANRLTRKHTYEGPARFTRVVETDFSPERRVFLDVERSRHLSLLVNGRAVPAFTQGTVSTPYVFELTGLLTGRDELTLICDNTYPGWPREAIVCSSAATDETQTNWNGLLGFLRLRTEKPAFIEAVSVYPKGDRLTVRIALSLLSPWQGELQLTSPVLAESVCQHIELTAGRHEVSFSDLPLDPGVQRWDEGEGNLTSLTAAIEGSEKTVEFGVRDFGVVDGHLTLNGRRFFLRSEANCALFPEEGHPPTSVEAWTDILLTYRGYGVNCVRFHSHCPPEAAFIAADRLGMLMQPELSHWNPRTAFESDESYAYYRLELESVLRMLANHPSFVMLTLGNELIAGPLGHARMDELLALARRLDPTRLYANASNPHYGGLGCDPASDFYTSSNFYEHDLRATNSGMTGWLNHEYAGTRRNYDASMEALRKAYAGAVISFEVGQYEVLPDFDELADFRGVTDPANYRLIRDKVVQRGLLADWKRRVEATGELSLRCYRAEIEAALRTEALSGISLLGLQDFSGQGTALVGMLNAHLKAKPFAFAQPERFKAFFTGVLPLALLPRFTWESGETLTFPLRMANYGKAPLTGRPSWSLEGDGFHWFGEGNEQTAPAGSLTTLGCVEIPLDRISRAVRLTLRVTFAGYANDYPIWVYPPQAPRCPANVYECARLDDEATRVLAAGGRVYLSPPSTLEALPQSIQAQFSTDFWSVGTFTYQEGGMGQLIDSAHPLFTGFPTDFFTDWQWWPMANQRALILPEELPSIVAVMDSYAYLRPMAQLLECRCGGGRLMISSLGLQDLQQYPEARALLGSLYRYMASDAFQPSQELSVKTVCSLVS